MKELPKDLREVSEKHKMGIKFGQSPIEVERVNYRHYYDESTKPPYRKVVRKVNFIENSMEDRYDISVDVGVGKDYSVATLFENGEYRPIALSDTISFSSDVEHSGYASVESGEYTFSAEVVPYSQAAVDALLGWSDAYTSLLERIKIVVGKRRKTTYKTIRRDCAKRNRHK